MCKSKVLKPLKPAVGQPAEGESKYFPRPRITKKIRRMMGQGGHILVSAPRRIGKTSLLKDIQAHPNKDQIIKYIVVQSVNSSEEFFRKMYSELIRDTEIYNGISGYVKQMGHAVRNRFTRLRGVSLEGGIEIDAQDNIDYYNECYELIRGFERKKVIIIIDEFPDALNNIFQQSRDLAIHFLQQHRDLRQQFSHDNLQFIYTGSTGLRNVVRKIGNTNLINDINEITVKPFSHDESRLLIRRLVLGYQKHDDEFDLSEAQIETILRRITWHLPYYLQAIVQSLFDHHEESGKAIDDNTLQAVFIAMTKAKSPYSSYFENWVHRLEKAFNDEDFKLAMVMLSRSAVDNELSKSTLSELKKQHEQADCKYVIHTLEYDGYFNEEHLFNSNLLKQWWIENVID